MAKSVAGTGLSPTIGNGIAYFALWYAGYKYNIEFNDPEMALVFAGGIIGSVLLELRRIGTGITFIVTKIWASKNDSSRDNS